MELHTYLRLKKMADNARVQLSMDASYPPGEGKSSPTTVTIELYELEALLAEVEYGQKD